MEKDKWLDLKQQDRLNWLNIACACVCVCVPGIVFGYEAGPDAVWRHTLLRIKGLALSDLISCHQHWDSGEKIKLHVITNTR